MPTVPYTRPVHYYETDRMDCVHHSNYIRWFEEARVHFMRESGFPYETLEAAGILSPVLSAQANYHAMCRFGDTVEILTQIESYTRTRIAFHYQVRDQATGQPRCDGWTTQPLQKLLDIQGKKLLLSHGHIWQVKSGYETALAAARQQGADLVLFGHTHRAYCVQEPDGLWVLNPGAARDSYGVVTIDGSGMRCEIVSFR